MTVQAKSSSARRPSAGQVRPLLILLGVFIGLEVILGTLVWMSSLRTEAEKIRLTVLVRQRQLPLEMVGILYRLRDFQIKGRDTDKLRTELKSARDLFDSAQKALREGGAVVGLDGAFCRVSPTTEVSGQKLLSDTQQVWDAVKERLEPVLLSSDSLDQVQLQRSLEYANEKIPDLLGYVSELGKQSLNLGQAAAAQYRTIQTILLVVLLIHFFLTLFYFIRCLEAAAEIRARLAGLLEAAREEMGKSETAQQSVEREKETVVREKDLFMEVLPVGIFVVNQERRLIPPFSAEMGRFLGSDNWTGLTFLQLLRRHLPPALYQGAADYVDRLFQIEENDEALAKSNPLLDPLPLVLAPGATSTPRYVSFRFRRKIQNGRVTKILVAVIDASAWVATRDSLRENAPRTVTPSPSKNWLSPVQEEIRALSTRLGKAVSLWVDAECLISPPPPALEPTVVQALRFLAQYSLANGVESPDERTRRNKPLIARLEVARFGGDDWGILWRDDGAGLDLAALRQRAVDLGLKTRAEADALVPGEVAQLLFAPGFVRPTSEAPELAAALSTLRRRVLEEQGGEIQVRSHPGRSTEFRLSWPSAAVVKSEVAPGASPV